MVSSSGFGIGYTLAGGSLLGRFDMLQLTMDHSDIGCNCPACVFADKLRVQDENRIREKVLRKANQFDSTDPRRRSWQEVNSRRAYETDGDMSDVCSD